MIRSESGSGSGGEEPPECARNSHGAGPAQIGWLARPKPCSTTPQGKQGRVGRGHANGECITPRRFVKRSAGGVVAPFESRLSLFSGIANRYSFGVKRTKMPR